MVSGKAHREALNEERSRREQLERELRRKEKALAETAALLMLRKKAAAIGGGRGRMISAPDRLRAVELIKEAVSAGARQRLACQERGLTERTLQRWQDETGAVRAAPWESMASA